MEFRCENSTQYQWRTKIELWAKALNIPIDCLKIDCVTSDISELDGEYSWLNFTIVVWLTNKPNFYKAEETILAHEFGHYVEHYKKGFRSAEDIYGSRSNFRRAYFASEVEANKTVIRLLGTKPTILKDFPNQRRAWNKAKEQLEY